MLQESVYPSLLDHIEMGSSHPKLSKEDMEYLLENTSYTKKQIKEWYHGFMVSTVVYLIPIKYLIIKYYNNFTFVSE